MRYSYLPTILFPFILLAPIPIFVSCAGPQRSAVPATAYSSGREKFGRSIDSLFRAAIDDTRNPEPKEIYRNLSRIQGNPNLIDTTIDGTWYLLVVSWKENSSYYPDSGPYNTGNYDIWVTLAPQIKERCINYQEFFTSQAETEMRLRQLLGLQPQGRQRFFLELWVRPDDLFRPCPDNETNDTECGLSFPNNVDSAYRYWFNTLRSVQYNDCSDTLFGRAGYPWTQLGYTYDWNPENPLHVGLSEFVIRQKSDVIVRDKILTADYCKR